MLHTKYPHINFNEKIKWAITPEQETVLLRIGEHAAWKKNPIYLVGGFVRDLVLGYRVSDIDLVFEGDARDIARELSLKYGGRISEHKNFKTSSWTIDSATLQKMGVSGLGGEKFTIDFITSRSESYNFPGALPSVRQGTILEDIRRRDFSINSLAVYLGEDMYGTLINATGGLEDILSGTIRVLHMRSFEDDPTRMFRAIRYAKRYNFKIDTATVTLIPKCLPFLQNLSPQRIRHELDFILEEKSAPTILTSLFNMSFFKYIHPNFQWNKNIHKWLQRLSTAPPALRREFGWILWLMVLSPKQLLEVSDYLQIPSILRRHLIDASTVMCEINKIAYMKPSQCSNYFEKISPQALRAILIAIPRGAASENIRSYLNNWMSIKIWTSGNILKKYGVQPGPQYQEILQQIKNARIDGMIYTEQEEKEYLNKLLNTIKSSASSERGEQT